MANKYNGDVTKDGTAVKMYDKSGNALSDGYSVNGTTYKANGERIDAGTTVAGNDGKMYTYNGEGKETTVHDPSTTSSKSSGSSSGAFTSGSGVSTSSSDYNTLVNQYANAQKEAQKQALMKSYQNTLNQIASAEATTKENAKSSRDSLSVQNQLANSRLARAFANAGLTNSGTNAQAQINSAGALQNGLGSIYAQENKALDDYQTQRNTAYSNLQSDIASANANIDANALQQQLSYLATMNQMEKELEYNNIWDDTVGRYVPFSFYQTTHPTATTTTSSGTSGGTSSGLTTKVQQSVLDDFYEKLGGSTDPQDVANVLNQFADEYQSYLLSVPAIQSMLGTGTDTVDTTGTTGTTTNGTDTSNTSSFKNWLNNTLNKAKNYYSNYSTVDLMNDVNPLTATEKVLSGTYFNNAIKPTNATNTLTTVTPTLSTEDEDQIIKAYTTK